MELQPILSDYVLLAGVAAFVAAAVNVLKFLGVVTDGNAPKASLLLNALGFGLFVVANVVGFDVTGVDSVLAAVASLILALLGLLGQLGVSKAVNAGLRGTPVIGYSHSAANPFAKG